MSYLIDTDVLSESAKRKPNLRVRTWLASNQHDLYVSTITIGEIRYGIEKIPRGKRRQALQSWLSTTCQIMDGRILSFNASVAHVWGRMRATLNQSGLILPLIDGQIAATAKRYDLMIVTRNEKDFERAGVQSYNPFDEKSQP